MSAVTRFLMIGGFLGAGKTTLMGRLAAEYQARGMRIGLVTNDQANDLVDTKLLQAEGFQVGEVAGACFCCSFDRLTETMRTLGDGRTGSDQPAKQLDNTRGLGAGRGQLHVAAWRPRVLGCGVGWLPG